MKTVEKSNNKDCECREKCWKYDTKVRSAIIEKVREEFPGNKTFFLDLEMDFEPGQFAMVWLPGVDEKPLALIPNGKKIAINIEAKGIATKKMIEMKEGKKFWIRGPYGKPFTIKGIKKAVIVAGGIGIDSIIMLAKKLHENKCKTKIVLGGRSKERIIFEKELKKFGKVHITTDDGSYGEKGFNVIVLDKLLENEKYDIVYACGPEAMIMRAMEIAEKHKTMFEASIERYMKCGIGVCGECAIDDKLVCRDGPVFSGKELSNMKEFGKMAYLKSGRRVELKEYFRWREE